MMPHGLFSRQRYICCVRHDELADVYCSVARTWSAIGERWTMMILRECFRGERQFEHFKRKLGLGRNVLSDRLQKLTDEGILERRQYQTRPDRFDYHLTQKGEDLYPILLGLMYWGDQYKNESPPVLLTHQSCGHDPLPASNCAHCGEPFTRRDITAKFAPGAW
jgi:DNA-binding HxlR family transcriptional regulator